MAGLVAVIAAGWHYGPWRDYQVLVATAPRPPEPHYIASIARDRFYWNMENSMAPVCAADVLFLGSSRVLVAFTPDSLGDYFQRRDLRYFTLAFGGGTSPFPKALFEKFDLHPRLVIANADLFFSDKPVKGALPTLTTDHFQAFKRVFEARAAHAVRSIVHLALPHFSGRDLPWRPFWEIYRREADGTWFFAAYKLEEPRPTASLPEQRKPLPEAHVTAGKRFKKMVEERGGRLVLSYIPSEHSMRWRAEAMARALGAPLVSPDLPGLMTYDGSHLDAPSVTRFSKAFLEELTPHVPHARSTQPQASQRGRVHPRSHL